MSSYHNLDKHCRVCGGRLQKAKGRAPVHQCNMHQDHLQAAFSIDVRLDDPAIHPQLFCNSCFAALGRRQAAASKGVPYKHAIEIFKWEGHKEEHCTVCEHLEAVARGGGKNKRMTKNRGRPTGSCTPASLIAYTRQIAPPAFTSPCDDVTYTSDMSATLQCLLCSLVLSEPVELGCGKLVCADCCCRWLENSGGKACPCCSQHELSEDTIRLPPTVVVDLLAGLKLRCGNCSMTTTAQQYAAHKRGNCQGHYEIASPSRISARDILSRSTTAPALPVERRVAEHLVRRLMAQSTDTVVRVPTRGQPLSLMPVTSPRVSTSEASSKTVQRRVLVVKEVRGSVSVGLNEELKALPKERRQELLRDVALPLEIPLEHTLAMKANLAISWNKLRTLTRWLKMFKVSLASERRQRVLAKEAVGDNLTSEMVPFEFSTEGSRALVFREAPFVFVPNLIAKVADRLTQHFQSTTGFTWHDGAIPSTELWVKLGGDKGHGSFKFNMQVVNVEHPKSTRNTTLLGVYMAGDSPTNLHTALDQYQVQVEEMAGMKWRERRIKVFFSGDYEFLCVMYGLSGASGRHCCLWCTICSSDLKVPLHIRGHHPCRSLESIKADHKKFVDAGADLKKAKEYNNAINEPFFPIPLENVCFPGLHLSLGIFDRLYTLLEEACQELDLQLAGRERVADLGGDSFQVYATQLKRLSQLREQHTTEVQKAAILRQQVTSLSLTVPAPEKNRTVQEARKEAHLAKQQLAATAAEIATLEAKLGQKFKQADGPFFRSLENVLGSLHVHRQAYHGGTFVGNHVHKLVQETSIEALCSAVLSVASDNCPEMVPPAMAVYQRFKTILGLFGKCHNTYNGGVASDDSIDNLEKDIAAFLAFYRQEFPRATILPKMHILEDHVVPWMRRWHIGAGLMGEQGAESIHAHFHRLETQYCGIVNPLDRLLYIFKEDNVESAPGLNTQQPPPKIYKKRS